MVVIVMLLAGGGIWFYFRQQRIAALRDVQAEVDRIHGAGEPITAEDMFEHHRVPPGVSDTTTLWLAAFQLAKRTEHPDKSRLPFVGEGKHQDLFVDDPSSLLPEAERFLEAHGKTIAAAKTAAAVHGECRFAVDFKAGFNASLEHVQDSRELARLLSLRLHVAAAKGDVDTALETLRSELALAGALEYEPNVVSQLVRIAILGVAFHDLRLLVSKLNLSEPELAELQQQLHDLPIRRPLKTAMIGERAMGYHAFCYMSTLGPEMKQFAKHDGSIIRPADCRFYLTCLGKMIRAADEEPHKARLLAKKVDDDIMAKVESANPLERMEVIITALLAPALTAVFDASARTEAYRDSAVAAIAFRRYQLKHGDTPDSLEALIPEFLMVVPPDPFLDGKERLKFAVEGDNLAIYSVGQDGKDDRILLADPESHADSGFVASLSLPAEQPEIPPTGGLKK